MPGGWRGVMTPSAICHPGRCGDSSRRCPGVARPETALGPMAARRNSRAVAAQRDGASALDSMRRIVRALGISARTAERSVGVTGAQLLVLRMLDAHPAQSLNELAALTFTHQSTVSVVAERLMKSGFVTRSRSESDRRRPAGASPVASSGADAAHLRDQRTLSGPPPRAGAGPRVGGGVHGPRGGAGRLLLRRVGCAAGEAPPGSVG